MDKIKIYIKDVVTELREKTTWPTYKDLQKEALWVLVATVVFSLLIFAMDSVFNKVMDFIYNL